MVEAIKRYNEARWEFMKNDHNIWDDESASMQSMIELLEAKMDLENREWLTSAWSQHDRSNANCTCDACWWL